jgi:hypothetical protein
MPGTTPAAAHAATTPPTGEKSVMMTTVSYNCKGFASSVPYIIDLQKSCDILCLTETWLRPDELHVVESIVNNCAELKDFKFIVFTKSSMEDIDHDYLHHGRPFGGLAMICKCSDLVTFNECCVSSDRVQSVYVSYRNGDARHLQALLDNPPNSCPVKLFGDFNAQLPQTHVLAPRWERSCGFSPHSKLLHDFLSTNNLVACDFSFRQLTKHAFCLTRGMFSWVNHVFYSMHDLDQVKSCSILPPCAENISDHLPFRTGY